MSGTIVAIPTCRRCHKQPCQFYGATGGFSVQCEACNIRSREKSRARSAKKREVVKIAAPPYPAMWTDYLTVHELRRELANADLMGGDLTNVRRVRVGGGSLFRVEIN